MDDLITKIIADAEPFAAGANRATHIADEMEHHMKHVALEIAGAFGIGFGIERSIDKAVDLVKQGVEAIKNQIESVVELAHLADRTGIGVDSLRALKREAALAGVEFETLQNSIKRMQINLGEAVSDPGGKKAAAFASLGLNPDELFGQDAAKSFAQIGDALNGIDNANSRVHMSFETVGKMGAETLGVLQQGTKGFNDALEHVGTISEQNIQDMEAYHRATIELDAAWGKLARTFAEDAAPAAASMMETFKPFLDDFTRGTGTLLKVMEPFVKDVLRPINLRLNWKVDFGEESPGGRPKFDAAAETQLAEEAKQAKFIEQLTRDSGAQEIKDAQAAQQIRERDAGIKRDREQTDLIGLYQGGHLDVEEFALGMADAAKAFVDTMERNDPLKKTREEALHLLDGLKTPEDKLRESLQEIQALKDKSFVSDLQAGALSAKAQDDFRNTMGLGKGESTAHERRVEGPKLITDSGEAYAQFFKNLQPNVDTEAQKQTEIQKQSLAVEQQIASILQKNNGQQNGGIMVVSISP